MTSPSPRPGRPRRSPSSSRACWPAGPWRTSSTTTRRTRLPPPARRVQLQRQRARPPGRGRRGVRVARAKATAFIVSSAYAGIGGALMALAYGRISPDVFTFQLSIDFLIMIVLGGVGTIAGAVIGAVFVVTLPLVLTQYSSVPPSLTLPGSGGVDAGTLARFLYPIAIILVLLFLRGGLIGGINRLRRRPPDSSGLPPVAGPTGRPDDAGTAVRPGVPTASESS
ncbi:branched-chain amino acid ABC transporter permease [Modestobacter sp. SYSU DS0875]